MTQWTTTVTPSGKWMTEIVGFTWYVIANTCNFSSRDFPCAFDMTHVAFREAGLSSGVTSRGHTHCHQAPADWPHSSLELLPTNHVRGLPVYPTQHVLYIIFGFFGGAFWRILPSLKEFVEQMLMPTSNKLRLLILQESFKKTAALERDLVLWTFRMCRNLAYSRSIHP